MTEQNNNGVSGEQMINEIQTMCLVEYAREILPRIREINAKKEELKGVKESVDNVGFLQQNIKNAQEELAQKIASDHNVVALTEEIKALGKELAQALKAASKGVGKQYKPKELKSFFSARATDKVVPIVAKGEMFSVLNETLQQAAV